MSLNILVIGNGGREHAIVWRLLQSSSVNHIYVAPGNGGTTTQSSKVTNVPISSSPKDFQKLQDFAVEKKINLVVPGPEQPLVDGITQVFTSVGIPVFGPSAKAAIMEGSKAASKEFMERHQIPTARFKNFTNVDEAKKYIEEIDYKLVLKADGIAAGKGVLIPETKEEALKGLNEIMVDKNFGDAGNEIVIEEYLEGDELSILTITDGYTFYNLPAAQDHKRIGDEDKGLNTGGMGAYAPAPIATKEVLTKIDQEIIKPTIDGMRKDGFPMCGVLFTGIMLTPSKQPKVLEYNVRFGDPETQTVLPLLSDDTDLAQVMLAAAEHRLDSVKIATKPLFSTTVVMAAGGYPEAYGKGDEITVKEPLPKDTFIFHAGTGATDGKVVTSGGRVIAATALGDTLRESVNRAYVGVDHVSFHKKYNRKDIAHRAFRDAEKFKQGSGVTYAESGVSVDNGNLLVQNIKNKVKSTARAGADSDIGGFGGLFDLKAAGYNTANTLLVAATDGVGTKLRIAQIMNIHNTVGIDLVAMNVNDLVVQGAEPLMFLDYFATGKLDVEVAAQFVDGVANGCIEAGCALVGGETSEMPGMYDEGHYDTNGTAVGAVDKNKILPKVSDMKAGNVLIGLRSNGIHSNGFSLVRKIIEISEFDYQSPAPWNTSKTIGEEVLVPTKIYVRQLLPSINEGLLLGLAHITGGGLVENIPRALPKHLQAKVDISKWQVPEIFKWFGKQGQVPVHDILKTFNLGIGMVLIVEKANVDKVLESLENAGEKDALVIGELVEKKEGEEGCVVENSEGLY
ncbi:Ade5,7 phosphoribosylamine-glycine ligase and phosphoribosylformylglycinamidine cyclo-ligase [Candida orthopsilosis Co 90-125]|uniref:Ade5,7 phosphoribosylamine-glycine ligase and phosphoribosylformylglycinamidine cyclo-ligase n=1 Tax=Candida orthopsilosis (strain 90-125) TaxID=1136231 RepID=H8WX15_CANO9|nr:Ade5,7 phosphoribosylamine-glycine ligase and phosphoribosylformylglycinamidine cyclo-ligase [Candida orthopsilosis Co 90-125]CCG21155.1 Ade5,7 phosphoribosylamine-glycine ligase and phosphoribosylformylglycinamidine cyclo-ligase [Candida orthopsilosis Co 90-125]